MDWDHLRLLRAVADTGSLRQAAEGLGLSQPTLGRRLRDLEGTLGTPLLVRHARGVTLTPEGQAALEAAHRVHAELDALQRGLSGRAAAVVGRVRIACTAPMATELLPPLLGDLRRRYPGLGVDLVVNAFAADLERREADLAIRMFQPERAALVARRVGSTHTSLFAHRRYLAARGTPTTFDDLEGHELIAPDREPFFVRQAEALGFDLDRAAYRTDAFSVVLALVRSGVAIGALLGAAAEQDPDLVPLLEPLQTHPVWLVTHPDLFTSAPVRAVWEALVDGLPGRLGRG